MDWITLQKKNAESLFACLVDIWLAEYKAKLPLIQLHFKSYA
jgi:hypothetical protein